MMMRFISLLLLFFSFIAYADEYEGFTEPNKEITVAVPEAGVLAKINVKEGDSVKKGNTLATLDNRVLEASLAIAKAKKSFYGRLEAARAVHKLRKGKLDRLLPLLKKGYAQREEVNEAQLAVESAIAEVKSAQEDLKISELEYKQIQAQIVRRTIYSPIDGIVTEVQKDVGEFAGGQEYVVIVANLDPLKINIHLPTIKALSLKEKQTVEVRFPDLNNATHQAIITAISPITDASSDTVKITTQLDNSKNELRSGLKCIVTVP